MLRTKQRDSAITILLTIAAVSLSCGSQPYSRGGAPAQLQPVGKVVVTKVEVQPFQAPSHLTPSFELAPLAPGPLPVVTPLKDASELVAIDQARAEALWAYVGLGSAQDSSDRPDGEAVLVSLQLGPRMAAHEFYIGLDGTVAKADAKEIRRLFRCRRTARTHRISQGLLAKIADLSRHYEGHTIEVVSAYRHGENAKPSSRHRHGRAIDIKIEGVKATEVRDYLWARYDEEVGVGFYRQQQFIHLDHRENFPATAWTQKHHNAENTYHPRWSRVAKPSPLVASIAGLF
tara:strand:- start:25063 stop:25929 length:867 start_codon:yes stop_codon:yes gene_type:complete